MPVMVVLTTYKYLPSFQLGDGTIMAARPHLVLIWSLGAQSTSWQARLCACRTAFAFSSTFLSLPPWPPSLRPQPQPRPQPRPLRRTRLRSPRPAPHLRSLRRAPKAVSHTCSRWRRNTSRYSSLSSIPSRMFTEYAEPQLGRDWDTLSPAQWST